MKEKHSISVWLDHASVMTTDLKAAISFYEGIIGLQVHVIEDDPIRQGRKRAMLRDDRGQTVLELMAMPEMAHPSVPGRGGIHHLGFRLHAEAWRALRSRLDRSGYPYQDIDGRLFVRDHDGLILELEQAEA
jgi:glyoxylase I family protein